MQEKKWRERWLTEQASAASPLSLVSYHFCEFALAKLWTPSCEKKGYFYISFYFYKYALYTNACLILPDEILHFYLPVFIQLYSYFYTWGSWPALPPLSNGRMLNSSNSWRLIFLMSKTGITIHAPHRFWWGLSEKIYVTLFVQRSEHVKGSGEDGPFCHVCFSFGSAPWAGHVLRTGVAESDSTAEVLKRK